MLFEPLTPTADGPFKKLGFAWDQPIPETAEWIEAKLAFMLMLRGKAISDWNITYSPSSTMTFLLARRLIVKFCHANALLPWLTRNFEFRYLPVFLLRHPFAVVASQLKHGNWAYKYSEFRVPRCRFSEHYQRHAPFLSTLASKEEALVAQWCLSNLVPLRQAGTEGRWVTLYYEQLLTDPEATFRSLFERWSLPLPDDIMRRITKPSVTTVDGDLKQEPERQLAKWSDAFSRRQLQKMSDVLQYFGVTEYGMGSSLPDAEPGPVSCHA